MSDHTKVVILHNIISPYKTLLFNELYKICGSIKVIYMAEKESNREWNIEKDEIKFPYQIFFRGQLDHVSPVRISIKTWDYLNFLNPDIIIIAGYAHLACWTAFFWANVNKKKIILWSASNEEDNNRLFLKERLKGFFVRRCDAANVYGNRSRDYLIKLGMKRNKIFIKGNTTDNFFYYVETKRLKARKEILCKEFSIPSRNFLYIGRFSKEKNIFHLLEAYKRIKGKNCNWGLILVGNGPLSEDIEFYIRRHAVRNVFMPGFEQRKQIPQYLAVSDVFILPSISEPWGLVVNEAMAAGLPVLVSKRCGCYPDLVKKGVNGYSFDPFDHDELFCLMKTIVEGKHDLLKMGKASLKIIKDYTPEKAAKIIAQTILFVLSNHK